MPKRGENIHKRKDGRWEGRYKSGTFPDGRSKYTSLYGKTYSEVKSKLISALQKNNYTSNSVQSNSTFGEVVKLWQEINKVKHKGATETKYDYLIEKHILPCLGSVKISAISTFLLNDFMFNKLQAGRLDKKGGLSPAYVKNIMLIITSVIKFAVNEQLCQPINLHLFSPSVEKNELAILSVGEQQKLESYLSSHLDCTSLGILISLNMGLRIGEVCALTWDNVDFENKVIYIRSTVARIKNTQMDSKNKTRLIIDKPKTKSSLRDIPIPSTLLPSLMKMREKARSKYVVSDKATFTSPRTFEYRYHKLLDICGIESINYHALRHTFATRCVEVGVDVKTLSEILGHADVSITLNTYVHPSMDLKRKQMEKLSALTSDIVSA